MAKRRRLFAQGERVRIQTPAGVVNATVLMLTHNMYVVSNHATGKVDQIAKRFVYAPVPTFTSVDEADQWLDDH